MQSRYAGPPSALASASRAELAKLQRVLGKWTRENEIFKEAVEYPGAGTISNELQLLFGLRCWEAN